MGVDLQLASTLIDGSNSVYAPHRIMGVRLRKLSLWHRLLLVTVNSPLMRRERVTMFDLRTAVGICRLQFGDSRVRRPTVVPFLMVLWAMIKAPWFRRRTGQPSAKQKALQKILDAFLEYSGDYLQNPEYAIIPPKITGESRGQLPDMYEHAGDLMGWGIPEDRAWNMPIGLANLYRIFARRNRGVDIDVMSEAEKKFQETLPPEFRRSNGRD